MGSKKSLICIFLFSAVVLFLTDARSEENHWKFMGKTKDTHYLIYYDTANVDYIRKDYVRVRLKKELSEEGLVQFRKDFYSSVKTAEEQSGGKVENPEPLLKALAKHETKEYPIDIDCSSNELKVQPDKMSAINIVVVDEIQAGTAFEKIRDEVCPKK
ncbi:MAG: hypothetical protein ACLQF0_15090 [Dissulfurispiraceae bacterium]